MTGENLNTTSIVLLHLLFLARSERVKEAEETAVNELLVVAVKLDARPCGQQTLEDVTGCFHQLNTDDANTNQLNTDDAKTNRFNNAVDTA